MKVLITGHKGFVGRYFWEKLDTVENQMHGIDKSEGNDCRKYFETFEDSYDLVIHLAAVVGGRETIEGRPLAVADNFAIDSAFFQWCIKTKPKKIVYFSSSACYPIEYQKEGQQRLLREDMIDLNNIKNPDLTYGWSKLVGEYLSSFLDNVFVFRPFSGYGTDQDLNYPFPMYIKRALEKSTPFEVWGPGTQTRDFIHIRDIVEAVLVSVESEVKGPVNLGWARTTSFVDLAELVSNQNGYSPPIVTRPDKPIGCMHRVSDNSKLLEFYTPKITLEEGIFMAQKGIR